MLTALRQKLRLQSLPAAVRREVELDSQGLPAGDPGPQAVIEGCLEWLCRAQDCTASADDGVARDFSLVNGWATSYPETTGYIVPTFLAAAEQDKHRDLSGRARRMLDWLAAIQFEDGGIQGGRIDAPVKVPVTFNTGQVLLGFSAGVRAFGAYEEAMHGAARFLRDSLDPDGCWRKFPTPFAKPGEKAYETHVSWGLFEAERVAAGEGYGEAGLRQVDWALTKQHGNGWVADCCLNYPDQPLTHTLGYFLKGVIEAHRLSEDERYLKAAEKTGMALLRKQREDGSLPGRLRQDWSPAAKWTCLTGLSQIADCWLYLYGVGGNERYLDAALRGNAFVRRTVKTEGNPDTRGGVKGAFPVDGHYGRFEFVNWAAKFTIDANTHELAFGDDKVAFGT